MNLTKAQKTGILAVSLIAVAALSFMELTQRTSSPAVPQPSGLAESSPDSSGLLREEEELRDYLSAAQGYLVTQNRHGMLVATAMAQLKTGGTTLTDVQR